MSFTARNIFCFLTAVFLANPVFANTKASSSTSGSQSGTGAKAASNSGSISTSVASQPPQKAPLVSGMLNMSRSTSLYDFQDGSRTDGLDYEGRLSIKISSKYSLLFIGGYSQNLKNSEGDDFSDTAVIASRAATEMGKLLLMGYGISSILPTSKDTYKNKGLLGSIGTSLNLKLNPDRLINGLGISGSVSIGRNFHEFETALDGKVNTQYSSKQSLALEYDLGAGFSLSGSFIHRNTWSYQNVMRDSFESSEELGYQFNPTFAIAVGHANSGATLKPNGTDSNVQLINENTSLVYASTTVMF